MKFIVDDNIPYLRGRLESAGEVVYVDQFGFTPAIVHDADAIVIRTRTRCDAALLENSSVKLIATATIGMDQIDLDWCAKAGISVANAPGCNAPGVAQYVWSSLLRMGFDPERNTLGIIGCGNVGGIVREWGINLGAKIIVNDPPRQEKEKANSVHNEIEYCDLDELLEKADAITIHTPLIYGGKYPTNHLIGEDEIWKMGSGKILINAARGAVVDNAALLPYVKNGIIRAAIDTWEGEPVINRELLDACQYGTFHIAGYSRQGKERATRMALEAIENKFGISVDKSGLEGAYNHLRVLTADDILNSYNPKCDTDALREEPDKFDELRRNYNYREEA